MADELDTDLSQIPPETPAEATPPPSPAPAAAAPSTPAAPAQQTPQTTPAPAAPSYESARDFAAKALGYKADTYSDDQSFLTAIVRGEQTLRRQLDEYRQREAYLYHQQSQQAKPAVADKPDPLARYKAPEFNAAWLSQVEKTPEGDLRVRPGGDPSILPKLHAYQAYQAEAAQKMTSDPVGYFKDMIEHVATQKAEALIKEQFERAQGDQYATNILRDNASWMLEKDGQGRIVTNPATGVAMLTPAGQRYASYAIEIEKAGVTNPAMQDKLAMQALKAELYDTSMQSNNAVAEGDKAKQALLQTMNRGNKSGSMTPPESGGPPVQNSNLSLGDRLRQLPDEAFAAVA